MSTDDFTPIDLDCVLRAEPDAGGWTVFDVPGSREIFGTGNPVKVTGTIDGHPVQITLMPSGTGHHMGPVKAATRKSIGKAAGDTVNVRIDGRAS